MSDPGCLAREAAALEAAADAAWWEADLAALAGEPARAGRLAAEARKFAADARATRTLAIAFDPDDQEDTDR